MALSPAGLWQWVPRNGGGAGTVPDAHDPSKTHAPTFLTTDLALRFDPAYEPISRRFLENPDQLADAFARVWFKLTHLDMGPVRRYLGPLVPQETLLWQDPVPAVDHELVDADDVTSLKDAILGTGMSVAQLVCHRVGVGLDLPQQRQARRGERGAHPPRTAAGLAGQRPRHAGAGAGRPTRGSRRPSTVPSPGTRRSRWPTSSCSAGAPRSSRPPAPPATTSRSPSPRVARTRRRSGRTRTFFAALEPVADGFRNYRGKGTRIRSEHLLVDRANLLNLSVPETAVLVGGLRVLGANSGGSTLGVLTSTPGALTNDFFVNLLDMGTVWTPTSKAAETFVGRDRRTGEVRWTAGRVDLVFGANAELRAVAEVYASDDAREKFVHDFVAAWNKVMNLDRYDLS